MNDILNMFIIAILITVCIVTGIILHKADEILKSMERPLIVNVCNEAKIAAADYVGYYKASTEEFYLIKVTEDGTLTQFSIKPKKGESE
jgi:hypothetical protein